MTVLSVQTIFTVLAVFTVFTVNAVLTIFAIDTVLAVNAIFTVFAVNAVLAVLAILAILTVDTVLAIFTVGTILTVFTVDTVANADDCAVRHRELIAISILCHTCDVASLFLGSYYLLYGSNLTVQTFKFCYALFYTVHSVIQLVNAALVVGTCHSHQGHWQYHPFHNCCFIHIVLIL